MRLTGLALLITIVGALTLSATPAYADQDDVLFVLDTSGSMADAAPDGTTTKLEVAVQALSATLGDVAQSRPVGLLAFGGDCDDPITARVPVAAGNHDVLDSAAADLVPGGGTPTGAAVEAAVRLLGGPQAGGTVILIADGDEDCSVTSCDVAAEAPSIDFQFIGVGVELGCDAANVSVTTIDDVGSLEPVLIDTLEPGRSWTSTALAGLAVVGIGALAVGWYAGPNGPAGQGTQKHLVREGIRIRQRPDSAPRIQTDEGAPSAQRDASLHIVIRPGEWVETTQGSEDIR